jgi:hypothetical protein
LLWTITATVCCVSASVCCEPLQQLSAVSKLLFAVNHYSNCLLSALLVAVNLLWWMQNGKSMWRLKTWDVGIFLFNSESSYVSKEYSFTNYNTLLHV